MHRQFLPPRSIVPKYAPDWSDFGATLSIVGRQTEALSFRLMAFNSLADVTREHFSRTVVGNTGG
jgi:hypothetical protein